jgi:hypothetical protein
MLVLTLGFALAVSLRPSGNYAERQRETPAKKEPKHALFNVRTP